MAHIVSMAKLKQVTDIHEDEDRYDDLLSDLVAVVGPQIEDYLGRTLLKGPRTEYLESVTIQDPDEFWTVFLSQYPVDTLAPVSIRYSAKRDWDSEVDYIPKTQFFLEAAEGVLTLWPCAVPVAFVVPGMVIGTMENPVGFRVQYEGGYPLVVLPDGESGWDYIDVPEGIRVAASIQVNYYFRLKTTNSFGVAQVPGDKGGQKATKKQEVYDTLLPEVRAMLRPYRKRGVIGRAS